MDPSTALLAASALHAGFSLVVTAVVYPALADVARDTPGHWATRHDAHSRRIVALVGPLYLVVAAACGWVLATGPVGWEWVALAGNAIAALVTATRAAPLHGRLGRQGPDPRTVRALLAADRIRTLATLVAVGAALLAVLAT